MDDSEREDLARYVATVGAVLQRECPRNVVAELWATPHLVRLILAAYDAGAVPGLAAQAIAAQYALRKC